MSFGQVRDGQLKQVFSVPSFAPGATLEQTMEYMVSNIRRIFTKDTEKIGIGVPSVVDVDRGVFKVPVAVNNDANCYAMGIYGKFPANDKPKSLVAVTLGTGVGIGIIENGRLFCGQNCGAGELGCLPYKDSILEDYCSKKFFTGSGWDSKEASKAAKEGNHDALLLFDEFGKHLGALVCAVLYAYDPAVVAFGGGIANNYPLFCQSMENYLSEHFPYRKTLERLKVDIFTDSDIPVVGASLI